MSFGFSVGDFLEVAKLIEATRKRLKGAPAEYAALADETRTLQIVVTDLKIQLEDDDIDDSVKHELQSALQNCEATLKDLNIVIDSHTELGPETSASKKLPQRIWKRLKWDSEEISKLRLRLVSARLSDIVQAVEKLNVSASNAEDAVIADWLAPATQAKLQDDYHTKVQAGTGQWILSDPAYCNWKTGAQPTLLLSGIPGAGKTFLASVIIAELQKTLIQEEDAALVFFYNSYNRTATQSRLDLVSSIMRQLFLQQSQNQDTIRTIYKEHRKAGSRPNLEEMVSSFKKLLLGFKKVTFIFDALDECRGPGGYDELKPWKYVLDLLFKLQKIPNCSTAILVLATSRPDKEIEGLFNEAEQLTIEASDSDLGIFCDANIPLIQCIANKPSRHPEIKGAICKSSRGMFLLAKLHCDTLKAKTKPREVMEALKTFQHGGDALDRAYEETMRRIQGHEHGELATKVLGILTYAAEPLTLTALRHALAVTEDTHDLDPEDDLDDPDILISSCAGLATVDSGSEVVRLVHYTTQRFLSSLDSQQLPDPHSLLASCCLNYLHLDTLRRGHVDLGDSSIRISPDEFIVPIRDFPFLAYSARYWAHHMSMTTPSLRRRTFSLLNSSGRAGSALAVLDREEEAHGRTGLHLLAYLGLDDWIREYIESGFDLNAYCDTIAASGMVLSNTVSDGNSALRAFRHTK
ncbi:hypothetical protein H2200_006866 [Cladophialophora chaetospira]|uniref:NACHT domain-containing protein n=1 Tax=Cladophialophora chaetospira TaxID=386627 RepID=A0AA38X972_9EURO|nr:hypothetical protein H2200_006866 [Cladophialophora chaetospira]